MKKIFVFLVILLTLLMPMSVFAEEGNGEYSIDNYDIEMVVNEDNSFEITENIGANFYIYKHGIYRYLPLISTIEREDGSKASYRARITDLNVSEMYETYSESGDKVIKIGDPNVTLIGPKDYTISYTYNIGKDKLQGYDELYYNIIGTGWDTYINNVTFKITMPKEFDASKLGFSVGPEGSVGYDETLLAYTVDGNVITGTYSGELYPGEALTVRMELPDGYFVGASSNFSIGILFSIILPILFVILSYIIWRLFGRDKDVIETVEFYPPEGYNSTRVGFLYSGVSSDQDVVSLIVYLANKGYIEIEEEGKKFVLRKVKEYDGGNEEESIFMSGLFATKDEVRASDLKEKFYKTVQKVKEAVNNKESRDAIFEGKFPIKRFLVVIMMIITSLLITVKPTLDYYGDDFVWTIMGIILPLVGIFWLFLGLFDRRSSAGSKIGGVVGGALFIIIPLFLILWSPLMMDPLYIIAYAIGIICMAIMSFFYYILPKRTEYGNQMLGKISGFKNFLELVEKPKLEALVAENPTYFYDILPFTYVLGLSDKWIKKFETITIPPPNWYRSDTMFNYLIFGHFMSSTMNSASTAMASRPSSSGGRGGGGGFSGGGFSGGGFGGGGGGSW